MDIPFILCNFPVVCLGEVVCVSGLFQSMYLHYDTDCVAAVRPDKWSLCGVELLAGYVEQQRGPGQQLHQCVSKILLK